MIADYWERAEFPFPLVPGFQVWLRCLLASLCCMLTRRPFPYVRLCLALVRPNHHATSRARLACLLHHR